MTTQERVENAVAQALMADRALLKWPSTPIRTWGGRYLKVLNWDFRRMAETATKAALAAVSDTGAGA